MHASQVLWITNCQYIYDFTVCGKFGYANYVMSPHWFDIIVNNPLKNSQYISNLLIILMSGLLVVVCVSLKRKLASYVARKPFSFKDVDKIKQQSELKPVFMQCMEIHYNHSFISLISNGDAHQKM